MPILLSEIPAEDPLQPGAAGGCILPGLRHEKSVPLGASTGESQPLGPGLCTSLGQVSDPTPFIGPAGVNTPFGGSEPAPPTRTHRGLLLPSPLRRFSQGCCISRRIPDGNPALTDKDLRGIQALKNGEGARKSLLSAASAAGARPPARRDSQRCPVPGREEGLDRGMPGPGEGRGDGSGDGSGDARSRRGQRGWIEGRIGGCPGGAALVFWAARSRSAAAAGYKARPERSGAGSQSGRQEGAAGVLRDHGSPHHPPHSSSPGRGARR